LICTLVNDKRPTSKIPVGPLSAIRATGSLLLFPHAKLPQEQLFCRQINAKSNDNPKIEPQFLSNNPQQKQQQESNTLPT
jgi:hypothetical protein